MTWHISTVDELPPPIGPDGLPAVATLDLLEARLPVARPVPPEGSIRVLVWRADVEPSPEDAARLLRTNEAAVAMVAMHETAPPPGSARLVASVASRLGAGHVLALLDMSAAADGRTVIDTMGLVSPHVLFKLGLERLPTDRDDTGSPCAVLAQLEIDHVNVTFATVVLDEADGPEQRARQMMVLLDRIDEYDRFLPVLIGGDLATTTFSAGDLASAGRMRLMLHGAAQRLMLPTAHEPMFHLLRQRGYDWRSANVPLAPTSRSRPPGADRERLHKRLWLFSRGLICEDPVVVPALDGAGAPMGSHDALSIRVRPS